MKVLSVAMLLAGCAAESAPCDHACWHAKFCVQPRYQHLDECRAALSTPAPKEEGCRG